MVPYVVQCSAYTSTSRGRALCVRPDNHQGPCLGPENVLSAVQFSAVWWVSRELWSPDLATMQWETDGNTQ
jgi:hypothetical protein